MMLSVRSSLLTLASVTVAIFAPFVVGQNKPIETTVCGVAKQPAAFDNKFVRLKAKVAGHFELSAVRDPVDDDCPSLWFTYPGSGPAAYVSFNTRRPTQARPAVQLKNIV